MDRVQRLLWQTILWENHCFRARSVKSHVFLFQILRLRIFFKEILTGTDFLQTGHLVNLLFVISGRYDQIPFIRSHGCIKQRWYDHRCRSKQSHSRNWETRPNAEVKKSRRFCYGQVGRSAYIFQWVSSNLCLQIICIVKRFLALLWSLIQVSTTFFFHIEIHLIVYLIIDTSWCSFTTIFNE